MKLIYEQDLKVLSSWTDTNVQMGLTQALSVVQDNMCEYFRELGCDGLTMVPICNCFFVVTKTKIRFNNFLQWLDKFKAISQISNKSKIKLNLNTDLIDNNGDTFASCVQEMCAMDATERSLRMLNTTLVPEDLEVSGKTDLNFVRMSFELAEEDRVLTKKVDVSNLDFYKHTNNVEYVRLMFSTLDLDFVTKNMVKDFEIHYVTESRFGDELKLYRKFEKDNVCFEIKKGENVVVKAVLNFEAR